MFDYEAQLRKVFDEVFENSASGSADPIPYQILTFDAKEKWYLDPVKKHMVKICNNTEIVQISVPDENNKVLVRGPGCFLYVPFDEIEDIGFN
jgi:hypothetical protein